MPSSKSSHTEAKERSFDPPKVKSEETRWGNSDVFELIENVDASKDPILLLVRRMKGFQMQSKHQQGHEPLRHLHQLIFLNLCGALFLYEHEIEVVRILQIVFRRGS